jgi:hypothetical protein
VVAFVTLATRSSPDEAKLKPGAQAPVIRKGSRQCSHLDKTAVLAGQQQVELAFEAHVGVPIAPARNAQRAGWAVEVAADAKSSERRDAPA